MPLLPPEAGRAAPLNGVRVGLEGWPRGVCPPPWWRRVQGSCAAPCFCPQHLRSGGWVLALLCLIVHAVICSPSRLCRCQHCSRGSLVPGPSLSHSPCLQSCFVPGNVSFTALYFCSLHMERVERMNLLEMKSSFSSFHCWMKKTPKL